jgi:regulator of protease activity HflC (stomatin/prohibitin superfamily)
MIKEIPRSAPSGLLMLPILFALQLGGIVFLVRALAAYNFGPALGILAVSLALFVCWFGFFMVQPKTATVLQLFGRYVGTVTGPGLRWSNPFFTKTPVSLRVRNFESSQLKVNDNSGSPIEIAAVVVWEVVDTAEAIFEVDDYEDYVNIQSEAALRNMAISYPYDQHDDGEIALRSHPQEISEALKGEVQDRLGKAGVNVIEARISHLAYAPEIASAMLRRQQATAVIAARAKVVEGAVGMVEMALSQLSERSIVELDDERKAAMVSNLLVVLCSDEAAQPIVNAGSIY